MRPPHGNSLGRIGPGEASLIGKNKRQGTDSRELALGPGHLQGSALPGDRDNCIIAGYRDGPLGRLRPVLRGDILETEARSGPTARYRVESVHVVDKHDTRPLPPSREPLLTLILLPLYIGHAPERFIVRSALVDGKGPPRDVEFSLAHRM